MPMMRIPQRKTGITQSSYTQKEWPKLASALLGLLKNPSAPLHIDSLVNVVYRICTAGLMANCYNDLTNFIAGYLDSLASALSATQVSNFLSILAQAVGNYTIACEKICVIFNYLDRQYIAKQLSKDLSEYLEAELGNRVIRKEIIHFRLKDLLPLTKPNASSLLKSEEIFLDPSVLQPLVVCLHHFEPNYYAYNPYLFSLYIPRLLPDKGLEIERKATQKYLDSHTPTPSGQPHKKRKFHEVCR